MVEEKNKVQEVEEVGGKNLDEISGGVIFHTPRPLRENSDHPGHWYEVLDDKSGEPIAFFASLGQAKDYCKVHRVSAKRIYSMKRVEKMRDAFEQHEQYYKNDPNWKNPYGKV